MSRQRDPMDIDTINCDGEGGRGQVREVRWRGV